MSAPGRGQFSDSVVNIDAQRRAFVLEQAGRLLQQVLLPGCDPARVHAKLAGQLGRHLAPRTVAKTALAPATSASSHALS